LRYDEAKLSDAGKQMAEFQRQHATQPGYRGSLTIDLGNGRRVAVNLWETEAQAGAAREALIPTVRRILEPLMAAPPELIGAGLVVQDDLSRA
jgi:hypothetical protein